MKKIHVREILQLPVSKTSVRVLCCISCNTKHTMPAAPTFQKLDLSQTWSCEELSDNSASNSPYHCYTNKHRNTDDMQLSCHTTVSAVTPHQGASVHPAAFCLLAPVFWTGAFPWSSGPGNLSQWSNVCTQTLSADHGSPPQAVLGSGPCSSLGKCPWQAGQVCSRQLQHELCWALWSPCNRNALAGQGPTTALQPTSLQG